MKSRKSREKDPIVKIPAEKEIPSPPAPFLYVVALSFVEFVAAFWVFDWLAGFFWRTCPPQLSMAIAAIWIVAPFRYWISSYLDTRIPRLRFAKDVITTTLWLLISIVKSVLSLLLVAISIGLVGAILFVGPYHLFQHDTRLGMAALCANAIISAFILCCCCCRRGK